MINPRMNLGHAQFKPKDIETGPATPTDFDKT